jgi:hypothetical protein
MSYLAGVEKTRFLTLITSVNVKKTFFLRQCCSGQISQNVCPWQSLSAWSIICGRGQRPVLEGTPESYSRATALIEYSRLG